MIRNLLNLALVICLGIAIGINAKELDINDAIELIQNNRTEDALPILFPLAEEGNLQAMIALGYYYLEKEDEVKGLSWFRKAAASGDAEAESTLGLVLTDIIERHNTIAEGVEWLEKAGEKGDRISAIKLAEIYHYGKGNVLKNLEKYNYWNERAQNY